MNYSEETLIPPTPRPVKAGPRSLGERMAAESQQLRAEVHDLRSQLQAARDELAEVHADGWAAVRRALLREARRFGIDVRRSSRDLFAHVLADRDTSSAAAALDVRLADQLRNTLARWAAGEIYPADARATLEGALAWRDAKQTQLEQTRRALHPGPAVSPCPECGRERGQWADDCSTCAKSSAAFLTGAEQ